MKNFLRSMCVLGLAVAAGMSAAAGNPTVEKRTLTLAGARQVIAAAKDHAAQLNAPGGVIAVVDDGGNLMALERIDGTFAAGAMVSIGKARTAVMFKKPTRFFEELVNASGKGRSVMTALNDFTPLIGGIPIMVDSQIVGGVGVSGAASADQDEMLAIAGADAFKNAPLAMKDSGAGEVQFFESGKVAAGFQQGGVLLDGAGGRNFMIHTSRREKPGQAEVHTEDADLIYVQEGTATLVTGGELVAGMHIAADEIRGASVNGGVPRKLAKGDVMVVPHGVPHQFTEVSNPFLYYVVKVR